MTKWLEGVWRVSILALLAALLTYAVKIDRSERRILQGMPDSITQAVEDLSAIKDSSSDAAETLLEIQGNTQKR